jgi:hypothetical protein
MPGAAVPHSAGALRLGWTHELLVLPYVLTPLEQKRLRAYGLRDIDIYLIANAATQTGLDVDSIRQLYLVHPPVEEVIYELNIDPSTLTRFHPEWTTPEWQEAVKRGDYTWLPPR